MFLCAVGHRRNILLYNGKLPAAPVRTVHYILRPFRRASGFPHELANAPIEVRIAVDPIKLFSACRSVALLGGKHWPRFERCGAQRAYAADLRSRFSLNFNPSQFEQAR